MIPLESNTAGELGGYTRDASVAKEKFVMDAWEVYHTQYATAYAGSGFSMQFAMIEISPGVTAYMPTAINYREEPDMVAPPAEPSKHPVWGTLNTAIRTITPWAAGAYMADSMFGAFDSMAGNAGNHYAGPVQMSGSYNTAGHGQDIANGQMLMDQATRTDSPGCSNGDCGETADSIGSESLESCLVNPPGGYNQNGTPMYNSTESCGSYF
ncbi:MAG: hypothetical protein GQ559_06125 [Desulfobulbaceae bacterium]|nr:hypothetical protein [Desulfobulbaceae bacterium]